MRFVPSTEELLHWLTYGTEDNSYATEPCPCSVCAQMRRLSDEED